MCSSLALAIALSLVFCLFLAISRSLSHPLSSRPSVSLGQVQDPQLEVPGASIMQEHPANHAIPAEKRHLTLELILVAV